MVLLFDAELLLRVELLLLVELLLWAESVPVVFEAFCWAAPCCCAVFCRCEFELWLEPPWLLPWPPLELEEESVLEEEVEPEEEFDAELELDVELDDLSAVVLVEFLESVELLEFDLLLVAWWSFVLLFLREESALSLMLLLELEESCWVSSL